LKNFIGLVLLIVFCLALFRGWAEVTWWLQNRGFANFPALLVGALVMIIITTPILFAVSVLFFRIVSSDESPS
jgi:hypothetical protein